MNQTVAGPYVLEVSSPGIDRPIRTLDAVRRFAGQRAALTTAVAHDGRRNYEGELLGPSDGRAGIRTDSGDEHWFEWTDVKAVHLVVDPWAGLRSAGAPRQGGGPR